jgi:glycosyltransferase involved in cell wall biosynthesis
MKIMFVVSHYYPYTGGVEYVVKSVAERLVRKRHRVTVLCGEPSINSPREEYVNGVHVFRWPTWAPRDAYHIPKMIGKLKNWLLNTVREHDVVHFHSIHSVFTVYCLDVLKNCKVPKVLTPHYLGTGHTAFSRILWQIWRRYIKRALDHVDLVHAASDFESKLVFKDFNVEPVIIGYGVEEWLSEINWSPSNYVMYSGRIEKYKNVHRLASIVKLLNDMGFNLELKIFGNGSYTTGLIRCLKKLKVKYELKSPQPYNEYITHLSRASLFGLLSQKENYGLTVNEANAIGVPVVVVEPWGLTFSERSRTLITRLNKSDEELAKEVAVFLDESRKQPRPKVPTWSQVIDTYIEKLYCPREN